MSNGISATGFFTANSALILNSEAQLTTLSQQINTGTKSTSLVVP